MNNVYDAIIIGGSYAGLSAAMSLGRSMRSVLIIDSGKPCNAQTPFSHNFLTQDGSTPAAIATVARKQVLAYPTVRYITGVAVRAARVHEGFSVQLATEEVVHARRLILATGIQDLLPDIDGLTNCWGISVIHCPYCHGYEFRGKPTGIMANGERAMHLAMLVKNLTPLVTIFTQGSATFNEEELQKLHKHQIQIVETPIKQIIHADGQMQALQLQNGSTHRLNALYAAVPFRQHSNIAEELGCELTEPGYIKINPFQQTTVEGVYACGDNSNMMRSVAFAVASGNIAGAMVNAELAKTHF